MNIWQIFSKLVPFVRPYKVLIIISLLLTLVGAVAAQINPLVLRYTVDTIERLLKEGTHARESTSLLLFISSILFGKELLNIAVKYGQSMIGERLRINLSSNLLQHAIEKILSYKYEFFTDDENATGKLQTRIDRGAESITSFIQNIFIDLLPLFANAILALILMFHANFYVGLVASFITPIYFLLSWKQGGMLKGVRRGLRALREQKTNGIFNIIESIIVIKSFVREEYETEKQNQLKQNLVNAQLKQRKTNYTFDALKTFIEQVGVVLIIILTASLVLDQKMSLGAIMFHILLFNNVSAPIRQIHRIYDQMNEAITYAEGFFEVLDANAVEESGTITVENLKGSFELKNVNFIYPNGTQALFDVNMKIPAGKTVAFVGLSGAGKSTLINLLCKFYSPTSGEILLDGKKLPDYDTHLLRRKIGLVLQKNHIFRGSIEENIRYGNTSASFEEIQEAAKKAYLHDQIEQLPNKYQSEAQSLSGGQQQRIAIARLFLKNPSIIFLDEPTASLDAIATEQIKNSLDAIKENRTVAVISHSISQIIDSEVIFVLKQGRVVESGTHLELYEKGGTYSEIFNASARSLNLDKISRTLEIEEDSLAQT